MFSVSDAINHAILGDNACFNLTLLKRVNLCNDIKSMHDIHISNGRVVRAFTSGVVDSGLIPSLVKPMTLKLVFTGSLLEAQN